MAANLSPAQQAELQRVHTAADNALCGKENGPLAEGVPRAPLNGLIELLVVEFLREAQQLNALAGSVTTYVTKLAAYMGCVYRTAHELAARVATVLPENEGPAPAAQQAFPAWTTAFVQSGANTLFDDVEARRIVHKHFSTRVSAIDGPAYETTSIFAPLALFALGTSTNNLQDPIKRAFYSAVKNWLNGIPAGAGILDRQQAPPPNPTAWDGLRDLYGGGVNALPDHAQLVQRLAVELVLVDVSRFGFAPTFCNPRRACVDGQRAPVPQQGGPYYNDTRDFFEHDQNSPRYPSQLLNAPQWKVMDDMSSGAFVASRMFHAESPYFERRSNDELNAAVRVANFAISLCNDNNVALSTDAKRATNETVRDATGARRPPAYASEGALWLAPLLGAIDHRMRARARAAPPFATAYHASTAVCELRAIILKLVSVPANSRARSPFGVHYECTLSECNRMKEHAETRKDALIAKLKGRKALATSVLEQARSSVIGNDLVGTRQVERLSNTPATGVVVTSGVGVAAAGLVHDDVHVRGRLVLELASAADAKATAEVVRPERGTEWFERFATDVLRRRLNTVTESVKTLLSELRDLRVECVPGAAGSQIVILVQFDATECIATLADLNLSDDDPDVHPAQNDKFYVIDELLRCACGVSVDHLVGTRHSAANASVAKAVTEALKKLGGGQRPLPFVVLRSHWWLCGDVGQPAPPAPLADDASFSQRLPVGMTHNQFVEHDVAALRKPLEAAQTAYSQVADDANALCVSLESTRDARSKEDADVPVVTHPSYFQLSIGAAAFFLDGFLRCTQTQIIVLGHSAEPYASFVADDGRMGVATVNSNQLPFFDPAVVYQFSLYMQHALTMAGCLYDAQLDLIRFRHTQSLRERVFQLEAMFTGNNTRLPIDCVPKPHGDEPRVVTMRKYADQFRLYDFERASSAYYHHAIEALRSIDRDDEKRWRTPAPSGDLQRLGRGFALLGYYAQRAQAFSEMLEFSTNYAWVSARVKGAVARAVTSFDGIAGHAHALWDRFRLGHGRVADALRSCAGAVTAGWASALDVRRKLHAAIDEVHEMAANWDVGANGALVSLAAAIALGNGANPTVKAMARDTLKLVQLLHDKNFAEVASREAVDRALSIPKMREWANDVEELSNLSADAYQSAMVATALSSADFRRLHIRGRAENADENVQRAKAFDVSSAFVEMSELESYGLFTRIQKALEENGQSTGLFQFKKFRQTYALSHSRLLQPAPLPGTFGEQLEPHEIVINEVVDNTPFRKVPNQFDQPRTAGEQENQDMFDDMSEALALAAADAAAGRA